MLSKAKIATAKLAIPMAWNKPRRVGLNLILMVQLLVIQVRQGVEESLEIVKVFGSGAMQDQSRSPQALLLSCGL